MDPAHPSVSVVLPARAAAETLPRALQSIRDQDYPNVVDVVVAATDLETARAAHGAVVVDNPSGRTPTGLNAAIAASRGEVVVRCDAHSVLPAGYISRAVSTMLRTGADNVGGMQVPVGTGFIGRAIAGAMASRLGSGDARYRVGGVEGSVETVYLGVFRRSILEATGGYDEGFERNQDYELNHRIRELGGVVWFDPELKVSYQPRPSLSDLASQYWGYGRWKREFSRRHPGTLRWRQLAPPMLVVVLLIALIGSPWAPVLLWVPVAYLVALLLGALSNLRRVGIPALAMPLAWVVMHLAWGAGFLTGVARRD